jgi:pimeloyl-ACP methyl ester carboxylesterase
MPDVVHAETTLGAGLPALVIGTGGRPLPYLPGLSTAVGLPTGRERAMAISGWEPLLDRFTIYRISRLTQPSGTSFAQMAAEHAHALEGLDPPVDLIGESTGGAIALHLAAARPDLVKRLVLVITGATLSANGRRLADRTYANISAGRFRSAYRDMYGLAATSALRRAVMGAIGWAMGPRLSPPPEDPAIILSELEAWRAFDGARLAPSVACPTLVIGTQLDPVFMPSYADDLAARIPQGNAVTIPALGHAFPPTAIVDHISPFLG